MTDAEILYDQSLWRKVEYIKSHSLTLYEFRDQAGVRFFVNPRTWRLRENFAFIVKTNAPNAIAIYRKFTDVPKLDKALPKNHKCKYLNLIPKLGPVI